MSESIETLRAVNEKLRNDCADLRAKFLAAEQEAAQRYDCRGGPGTTEPACNACVTCLLRLLEHQNQRELHQAASRHSRQTQIAALQGGIRWYYRAVRESSPISRMAALQSCDAWDQANPDLVPKS